MRSSSPDLLPAAWLALLALFALPACSSKGDTGDTSDTTDTSDTGDTSDTSFGPVELAYDDDGAESNSSPWGSDGTGAIGVHFTAPGPCRLLSVRYYVGSVGLPRTPFGVEVSTWDPTTGLPGDTVLHTGEAAASHGEMWVDVELSGEALELDADFVVAMVFTTPPGEDGMDSLFLGTDASAPDDRTFVRYVLWDQVVDTWGFPTDAMIRAVVEG